MIKGHHEKLDGSGYPDGLKGDELSTEARIMAEVDIYDALIKDRPYRKRMKRKRLLRSFGRRARMVNWIKTSLDV